LDEWKRNCTRIVYKIKWRAGDETEIANENEKLSADVGAVRTV
jgi:hypothetical protein